MLLDDLVKEKPKETKINIKDKKYSICDECEEYKLLRPYIESWINKTHYLCDGCFDERTYIEQIESFD